jgi:hypothetical protein
MYIFDTLNSKTMSDSTQKNLIASEVRMMQDAFASTDFLAEIKIMGTKDNGEPFIHVLTLDESNQEFKDFLNAWGARRSAELL